MMLGDFIQTAERIMVYDKRRPKVIVQGADSYEKGYLLITGVRIVL